MIEVTSERESVSPFANPARTYRSRFESQGLALLCKIDTAARAGTPARINAAREKRNCVPTHKR